VPGRHAFQTHHLRPRNRIDAPCSTRRAGTDRRALGRSADGPSAEGEQAAHATLDRRTVVGDAAFRKSRRRQHRFASLTIYWSTPVTFRFGTAPTGIRATSFMEAMSTTETSLVTGFAT